MANAKFTLTPNPTFKASVSVHIPGGEKGKIEFTFKHRSKKQIEELFKSLEGKQDVDLLLDIAEGWELKEPLNRDTAADFLDNYFDAGPSVFNTYLRELTAGRLGN